MNDLIVFIIVTLFVLGNLFAFFALGNFIFETIRMIFDENYRRKYDISLKKIDYNLHGGYYINFWGRLENKWDKIK